MWLKTTMLSESDSVLSNSNIFLGHSDEQFFFSLQKDDFSCGMHSARMVIKTFYPKSSTKRLPKELKLSREGTSQSNLVAALRKRRITVTPEYSLNRAKLKRALKKEKCLVVYHVNRDHWMVVKGYRKRNSLEFVEVADPEFGVRSIRLQEFFIITGKFALICGKRI